MKGPLHPHTVHVYNAHCQLLRQINITRILCTLCNVDDTYVGRYLNFLEGGNLSVLGKTKNKALVLYVLLCIVHTYKIKTK